MFTGFDHGDVAESGDSDRFPDVVATPWRKLRRENLPGLTDYRCDLDAQPPVAGPDVGHRVARLNVEQTSKAIYFGLTVPTGEHENRDHEGGAAQPAGHRLPSFHRTLMTRLGSPEFRTRHHAVRARSRGQTGRPR